MYRGAMDVAERRKFNVKGEGCFKEQKTKKGEEGNRGKQKKKKKLRAECRPNCTAVGGRSPDLQVKSPTLYQWY